MRHSGAARLAPAQPEEKAEAKAALTLGLRRAGIRDLSVLRAFESVPRRLFLLPKQAWLAKQDVALPVPCGQTTHPPGVIAPMLEALRCGPEHRVLEVGSGSGYVTALLAHMAGPVVGVERFRTLAEAANARLQSLGLNAAVAWADGFAPGSLGRSSFHRILIQAAVPTAPAPLLARLAPGGLIVFPRVTESGAMLMRAWSDEGEWREEALGASVLRPAIAGRSAVL